MKLAGLTVCILKIIMAQICLLHIFRCPSHRDPMWSILATSSWLSHFYVHTLNHACEMVGDRWSSCWWAHTHHQCWVVKQISRLVMRITDRLTSLYCTNQRERRRVAHGEIWYLKSKSMHTNVLSAAERGWSRYTISIQIFRSLPWFPVVPVMMSAAFSPLKDMCF